MIHASDTSIGWNVSPSEGGHTSFLYRRGTSIGRAQLSPLLVGCRVRVRYKNELSFGSRARNYSLLGAHLKWTSLDGRKFREINCIRLLSYKEEEIIAVLRFVVGYDSTIFIFTITQFLSVWGSRYVDNTSIYLMPSHSKIT